MDELTTHNRPPDDGTRTRFGWLRVGRRRDADSAESGVAEHNGDPSLHTALNAIVPEAAPPVLNRLRSGIERLHIGRPEPSIAAFGAIIVAVAFLGGLTYYGSREFTSRAADRRGADEAASLAQHSARLATGDAFNGYLQILKYAEDPLVRGQATSSADRIAAMQQLLFLNTNKLESLAIADRAGIVLASTDTSLDELRSSEAFNTTRANLGPANSDIILPEAGKHGYVEFTAPLRDPDGTMWAILYGRANPAKLWSETLKATVDGSRNVIINSAGQFSAGVPDTLLRSSWRGEALDNGSVRATIDGTESICGLGPIGRETQIDRGWNVASCLPASLMQAEASRALGKQALVTLAGSVLAIVFAGTIVRFSSGGAPGAGAVDEHAPTETTSAPAVASAAVPNEQPPAALWGGVVAGAEAAAMPDAEIEASEPQDDDSTQQQAAVDANPSTSAPMPPAPIIVADVDGLTLIEAYERRNARLSQRLRESVLARLMVATTKADQAYRLAESDPNAAAALHARAMDELEQIRERDLRSLGQELHPGLVRLGLPSALRSLAKEFAGVIDVSLDIDPTADRVSGGHGTLTVATPLRLVAYRAVRDAVYALTAAGGEACHIWLQCGEQSVSLSLLADLPEADDAFDITALDAGALSLAAYGAACTAECAGGTLTVACTLPATELPAEERLQIAGGSSTSTSDTMDDAVDAEDIERETSGPGNSQHHPGGGASGGSSAGGTSGGGLAPTDAAALGALASETPGRLGLLLGELRDGLAGEIDLTLDIEPGAEAGLGENAEADLQALISEAARNLVAAGARRCTVSIRHSDGGLTVDITSDSAHPAFAEQHPGAAWSIVESHGGTVSVSHYARATTVSAELPLEAGTPPDDEATPGPRITVIPATPDPLGAALRALAPRVAQSIDLRVQADPAIDALNADGDQLIDGALRGQLFRIVEATSAAFAGAGAARCDVSVQRSGGNVHVSMTADPGDAAFDDAAIASSFAIVEERGGEFSISRVGSAVAITARVPLEDPDAPKVVRLNSIAPLIRTDDVA